jgi:hypothetical protein
VELQERYMQYLKEKESLGECPSSFETWLKALTKIRPALADKYPHYYRELPEKVSHLDVYRVLDTFQVRRSTVQHAVKKLLCTGTRGLKNEVVDIKEAIFSLQRTLEMIEEEQKNA